jgi:hypothetical protein
LKKERKRETEVETGAGIKNNRRNKKGIND